MSDHHDLVESHQCFATIEIPEIGVSAEIEADAPSAGKPKVIVQRLSWSQNMLMGIVLPMSSDMIFCVNQTGSLKRESIRSVRILAIIDAHNVQTGQA